MKKSLLFLLVLLAVADVYIDANADTYTPPDREPPIRTQGGGSRNRVK